MKYSLNKKTVCHMGAYFNEYKSFKNKIAKKTAVIILILINFRIQSN